MGFPTEPSGRQVFGGQTNFNNWLYPFKSTSVPTGPFGVGWKQRWKERVNKMEELSDSQKTGQQGLFGTSAEKY